MAEPLPADIVSFLDSHVESIDQLEILRILGETPSRGWPVASLATEAQASLHNIAAHLAALRDRGLLSCEGTGADLVWRFAPATPELATIVLRVLQIYRERPVSMIKLVYARADDPLRAFANAFRLRKGG
ncbi:MAG: hypothetical protein K8U57_32310 [Planctomycetes bacterium]|nr:hypothetical protein [Planctomycetota bacterium]